MTPAEIEWALCAFRANRRREEELTDLAAWLAGRYAAIGLHAPRKYPRRPDGLRRPSEPMSDEDMKRVLTGLADRGGRASNERN